MKPFFAPLFEALHKHASNEPVSFHVPGHHSGQALKKKAEINKLIHNPFEYFYKIMQLDVTELSTTDDLHHPEASIKEAQQLAANTFGAEETFFLVGGSTSGNIALLLALCQPDDMIIVQRNVHKSVLNGLRLAGARAVFLSPQIDAQSGLATIPSIEQVKEALILYPEAKAVFLSNPNYYGMGVKLAPYVQAAHAHHMPILVDEAHGAHYGFHSSFPKSALSEGVDAVVQSAHKTLPTMTMGALLHVQGDRIPIHSLRESLAMIQSSSPSFPILASIDISRAMIDTLGPTLFDQSLASANAFRRWLREQDTTIRELSSEEDIGRELLIDPLRIVLYDSSDQLTGYELQKQIEQYGCFAEMADPRYVVLVFGIETSLMDTLKLQKAIQSFGNEVKKEKQLVKKSLDVMKKLMLTSSEPVSFRRNAFNNKSMKRVALETAESCMSAEMVIPYPPGIAILYPGERITAEMIAYIRHLAESGAKFQGAEDAAMSSILVFE